MNEKSLMKAEINKVCDSLLMSHDMGGHISVPTILICYIGEETQRIANASLQDAFASSFKRSIPVYDFTISSSEETIEEIQAKMILSIQKMMDEGKGISGSGTSQGSGTGRAFAGHRSAVDEPYR